LRVEHVRGRFRPCRLVSERLISNFLIYTYELLTDQSVSRRVREGQPKSATVGATVGSRRPPRPGKLSINLAAVSDTDNEHEKYIVFDSVADAIIPDTDSPVSAIAKLDYARRSGITRQPIDGSGD
jgi:hypothetical protein